MEKCDCYRIELRKAYTYHPITGQFVKHDTIVGVCWGTKEIDKCDCGGDKTKCDFYSEVRDKAQCELEYEKVVTNADKIRSMTNDELADFFFESPEIEFEVCEYCKNFGGRMSDTPCKHDMGLCYVADKNEAFKKWLQQPYKEKF